MISEQSYFIHLLSDELINQGQHELSKIDKIKELIGLKTE